MRLSHRMLALGFCIVLSGSMLASQDSQTPKSNAKPLTNGDVVDMLKVGLSPEIVIAKINASACAFDTSPAALKVLKSTTVPDAVILAMVQAPTGSHRQELSNAEPSAPARIDCKHTNPVPVYSSSWSEQTLNYSGPDSGEVFKVKCGDRITLLNPGDKQSWLKIRTADGQVGYIYFTLVSREQSGESAQERHPSSESKKREDIQKASDDLEDCRVRAQNEYDTKLNLVGTLTLSPIQRVYASTRLKQNLDAEIKSCRAQYESRLKALEAE